MSYIVLARKHRPQSFAELVGQLSVSQTLTNAISSGRIAHAYIFSGPRGVGKTTTARVLAKCLNCVKGPTTTPCQECESCRTIGAGTSVQDVLEIDAASNRGIEQIRELRESVKYAPAASRYRIFIIDEAHQITKDAFGALLKTLEEPPAHAVFMMATTEVHKIPAPILSRCQRFTLRPISAGLVFNHLKTICATEKIPVDDAALKDIVRFVEGSLRDALSLLDQAIVFSPKGITSGSLRELLGLLPAELVRDVAAVLRRNDPGEILRHIQEAARQGTDLTQLAKDLQNHYHELILIKAGVEDPFGVENATAKEEATQESFPGLERKIRLLSQALEAMRHADAPRAVFDVYALRLAQQVLDPKTLIERLERLETAPPASESAATPPPINPHTVHPRPPLTPRQPAPLTAPKNEPSFGHTPAAGATAPHAAPKAAEGGAPPPATQAAAASADTEPSGSTDTDALLEQAQAAWPAVIEQVRREKAGLASALEEATLTAKQGRLVLTFEKSFYRDNVERNTATVAAAVKPHLSTDVSITTALAPAPPSGTGPTKTTLSAPPVHTPPSPGAATETQKTEWDDISPDEAPPEARKAATVFPGTLKKPRKPDTP